MGSRSKRAWPGAEVANVARRRSTSSSRSSGRALGTLPTAIGHRVVHGGPDYSEPVVIDDAVLDRLDTFPHSLRCTSPTISPPISAVRERQPKLLQVACFDTAFHRGHPEVADRYALPEQLYAEGVRRYGFHGLSYEYIANRLPEVAPEYRRRPGRRRPSRQRRLDVRDLWRARAWRAPWVSPRSMACRWGPGLANSILASFFIS